MNGYIMVRSAPNSDRNSIQPTTPSRQPLLPPDPQCCSSPGSHWPGAVLCYSHEFGQHFVHEDVNIGECIPRARRRLCRTDGGSHVQTRRY